MRSHQNHGGHGEDECLLLMNEDRRKFECRCPDAPDHLHQKRLQHMFLLPMLSMPSLLPVLSSNLATLCHT